MNYWLMKSEPDLFGIDDLQRVGVEPWGGVRNYQVRNMIRDQMRVGDLAFIYHLNCTTPGIVGIMRIHVPAILTRPLSTREIVTMTPKIIRTAHAGTWWMSPL